MSNRVASEPMLFGHTNRFQWMVCIAGMAAFIIGMPSGTAAQQEPIAIVGATIIDGNGGPPLMDGTILIEGERISAVGPRSSVGVPDGTRVIDGAGKYVTPGFIDTNVHMSLAFGRSWTDTNARYWPQHDALVLQGVQQQLKYGITTIRDSYGALLPMKRVKEAIERGEVLGPRMYVAGNIVGWGGPYSETFSGIPESELSLFEEQLNDSITLGSGEEWIHMTPENLRTAVNEYLDFGPDFIKYGGTHHRSSPSPIMFSPRAQRVIVEELGRCLARGAEGELGLRLRCQVEPEHLVVTADPGQIHQVGAVRRKRWGVVGEIVRRQIRQITGLEIQQVEVTYRVLQRRERHRPSVGGDIRRLRLVDQVEFDDVLDPSGHDILQH